MVALAVLGTLGGIAYKLDHNGYERGKGEVKQEWDAAVQKGVAAAEAERKRQEAARAAQDKEATRRLSDAQKRSRTLMVSLEAHIKASGAAAQCPVPASLRDAWNASHQAGEGVSPAAVPPASRKPAPSN